MQQKLNDQVSRDEDNIWEFVYRKLHVESEYKNICEELWEDYIKSNGKSWTVKDLNDHYETNMMNKLHNSFMADHKILALFKLLKYPFTEEIMTLLDKRTAPKMKVKNGCLYDYRMSDYYYAKIADRSRRYFDKYWNRR